MIRWKRSWPDLSEDMPVDILPASNGEFSPPPPTREQILATQLANEEAERYRRRLGMSRRHFVRTAMAYTVGFWAMNQVYDTRWGRFADAHNTDTTKACDLEWDDNADPMATLLNLPGEFIFDVQSHHVESDGMWRVTNPGFEAFFSAIWGQAGPITGGRPGIRDGGSLDPGSGDFIVRGGGAGELDPIENLSRFHYLKELFLDSATTMTVLSAVPAAPDITQPLPITDAVNTAEIANNLAGSQRTVLHAFVMPNRGSAGSVASVLGQEPLYMKREFEIMEERAVKYRGLIRGWKTYPAWGDIPYASGWFFDDPLVGIPFIEKVAELSAKYPGLPPNIATHKGFALPAFDQRAASPREMGRVAAMFPDVNFIVYHSGFDGEAMGAYAGDANVNSADRTVDSFIKSLRENTWDASRFADSTGFGNVPNVYAEIGSTFSACLNQGPGPAAHLLGKLIKHVGPKRIAWGTDSLWFGSPQSTIVGLRKLQFTSEMNELYGLGAGLDSDVDDPGVPATDPSKTIRNWIFGRAAAAVYGVDADVHLNDRKPKSAGGHQIACDDVQKIRDAYILNQMTPREQVPMASNNVIGPRTPRELFKMRKEQPWGP